MGGVDLHDAVLAFDILQGVEGYVVTCQHPDLRIYDDGLTIHCVHCMRAWGALPYYPPTFKYEGERPFPKVQNNKVYLECTCTGCV